MLKVFIGFLLIGMLFKSAYRIDIPIAPLRTAVARLTPAPTLAKQPVVSTITASNVQRLTSIAEIPTGMINDLAWSSDSQIIAIANYQGITLYHAPTFTTSSSLNQEAYSRDIAFSPDGSMLAVSTEDEVKIWSIHTKKKLHTLKSKEASGFLDVTFSSDGSIVLGVYPEWEAVWWDVATGDILGFVPNSLRVVISPDNRLVAVGNRDGSVDLRDVRTNKIVTTLRGHKDGVEDIVFTSDSASLLTGSLDGKVILWDLHTSKQRATLQHDSSVYKLALSANSQILAVASSSDAIVLWDLRTTQKLRIFDNGTGGTVNATDLLFNQDTTLFVRDANHTVLVWDVTSGKEVRIWQNAYLPAFSPDGTMLAFGRASRTEISTVVILGIQ